MKEEEFINPIDKDKITETPSTLPYAHTIGGAVIKPYDKGRIKGQAIKAMEQQTERQLQQIREQIDLLAQQAQAIQKRVEISTIIYSAEIGFKPLVNHIYHLYLREDETAVLSMIGPNEWGKKGMTFTSFLATVRLLADHTWEILNENG